MKIRKRVTETLFCDDRYYHGNQKRNMVILYFHFFTQKEHDYIVLFFNKASLHAYFIEYCKDLNQNVHI